MNRHFRTLLTNTLSKVIPKRNIFKSVSLNLRILQCILHQETTNYLSLTALTQTINCYSTKPFIDGTVCLASARFVLVTLVLMTPKVYAANF